MPMQTVTTGTESPTYARQPQVESASPVDIGASHSAPKGITRVLVGKFREFWGTPSTKSENLRWPAAFFILLQVLVGLPLLPYALLHWHPQSELRFICFFAVALAASVLKVRLPGIEATMSANFLFILVGILDLSYPETLLMGCFGGLVQSIWHAKPRPRLIQLLFNFANLSISITAANLVFHSAFAAHLGLGWPLLLVAASTIYFAMNTMSVSGIIALTEKRNPLLVWKECYLWSFPYYLLGAMIAAGVSLMNRAFGWQFAILVLPLVYWMYRSYRTYLDRLEAEKKHTEAIADLHLRTIEALSLAIEAKDHNTHDHLRRVQTYAIQLGKDLGLDEDELNALRAASMLHDIGKLAVPEQILSKPGRLTPEEFDRMKIHPVVGAEILDRVQFPYPVVPIVLSHHEKWNGAGYPYGLSGVSIPIGARILAVVDCFDALTSERPYRRAISHEDAIRQLISESGTSFDPRVVKAIEKRYRELEQMDRQSAGTKSPFESISNANRLGAPSAGFAEVPNAAEVRATSFLASIVSARQEAQLLFELAQTLGNSLSLRETLSVVAVRLKEMIPHDLIVVYVRERDKLTPRYLHGVDFALFGSLEIPIGQGISGWVAQHEKPITNGDPASEFKHLGVSLRGTELQSTLSIPLQGREGVAGVISLYLKKNQGFSKDHLRMLMAASSKLGQSVENALEFEKAQDSASTDFLTELPNARSICAHLNDELARSERNGKPLAVLLCDLNGFKTVNDNYGHLTGNKLLQAIAKNLRDVCRDYDLVGRLGGDEFILVLPEFDAATVAEFLPRVHGAVEDAAKTVCNRKTVSVSVGASFYPQHGVTPEELLSEADRAMYDDKETHYRERGDSLRSHLVKSPGE
jgi:diguanylate cyclase (GGDEF)-like protein/putative nucleotidyltransferase with HDIG domain